LFDQLSEQERQCTSVEDESLSRLILYSNLGFLVFTAIPLSLFLEFKTLLPNYLKPIALVAKGLLYAFIFMIWILQCLIGNAEATGRYPSDVKDFHPLALGIEGTLMGLVSMLVIADSQFAFSCDPAMMMFQMIPGVLTAIVIAVLFLRAMGTLFFLCFKCCQRAAVHQILHN
jgi:hypothetical protein